MLQQLQFASSGESLFGMFDGGTHTEVPLFVANNIADVLRSEVARHQIPAHTLPAFVHQIPAKYMKYAMLSMHRFDRLLQLHLYQLVYFSLSLLLSMSKSQASQAHIFPWNIVSKLFICLQLLNHCIVLIHWSCSWYASGIS